MGDITVDLKGASKLLYGLNVHKAPGPDGLNAIVLKECSNEISPILALIFNESLAQGDVPDEWRQANVSPVSCTLHTNVFDRNVTPYLHLALCSMSTCTKEIDSFTILG